MIYLIGVIAILANVIFYIFLKFSLWILFFNILILFIFIIFINYQKEDQNTETKKKIITNFNSELGKKDLERLFIDKIEDVIIILNKFNVIIYANKSATNNFGEKLEGKHISVAGGGRKNKTLIKFLSKLLNVSVESIDQYKLAGDFIESQAFAYLAIRSLEQKHLSLPTTTGVSAPVTGGIVYSN